MKNTMVNGTVNYIRNWYKDIKGQEEKYSNFFSDNAVNCESKIKSIEKEINELKKAIEKKIDEKNIVYQNSYVKEYEATGYTEILEYENNKGNKYYYNIGTEEEISEHDYEEIKNNKTTIAHYVDRKSGSVSIVVGYCYNLGSLIVRHYSYRIGTNNSKIVFKNLGEYLLAILDHYISYANGLDRNITFRDWEKNESLGFLNSYNATDFINNMFNVNIATNLNLYFLRQNFALNANFETIVKTAPNEIIDDLIKMPNTEAMGAVYKMIGISKDGYNEAINRGLIKPVFELRNYIKNKDIYGKTEHEWLDLINDFKTYAEELNFYKIKIEYKWDYKNNGVEYIELAKAMCEFFVPKRHRYSDEVLTVFTKNYSFGKFVDYVITETINQGYTRIDEFVGELKDYIKMCEAEFVTPTLYSSYLKQTHDIASRNHSIIVEEQQEELFKKIYAKDKIVKLSSGYMVVPPKDTNDIKKEGDVLNHCVASYIKRIIDQDCKIMFLRKKEDESLITMEIRDGRVAQVRGLHNRKPTQDESNAIHEYAEKNNLEY